MAKLAWQAAGSRRFETGCDRGVLYPEHLSAGVPWNGLVAVEAGAVGGDERPLYLDGVKYSSNRASTEFSGVLTAFYSPREFDECEGYRELEAGYSAANQPLRPFGLSWRTRIGDEIAGAAKGYKIHMLYGATAAPTRRSYETIADTDNLEPLSWDISAVPPMASTRRPTAYFVLDSTRLSASRLTALENTLYGTSSTAPRLPTV